MHGATAPELNGFASRAIDPQRGTFGHVGKPYGATQKMVTHLRMKVTLAVSTQ
jgi:hypothetical protein